MTRYVLEGDLLPSEGYRVQELTSEQAHEWLGQRIPTPLTNVTDDFILQLLPSVSAMPRIEAEVETMALAPGDEALVVRRTRKTHDTRRPRKEAAAARFPELEFVLVTLGG